MIKAPTAVVEEVAAVAARDLDEQARTKGEAALRRVLSDDDGRYFLKWLMAETDLDGPSDTPRREGARDIGRRFKASCDSLGPDVYAGLVAEMTRDREAAEALRAKALE